MESMSPQQQHESLSRASLAGETKNSGQHETKKRMRSSSQRRQSAPSMIITKALTRSRTVSRESSLVPVCPESCLLVQSFLVSPDRSFLLHGHAQLKTGLQTQDRDLFLFNDILVIAKAKSANHFKQKAIVCVCDMWTAGCMEEVCEGSTCTESSFVMGWPTCNCVAMFSSAEQKERWLTLLKSRIKEEKEKEEPKTIPLKVHGKGINTLAVTKTLPVSHSDSTNEVVRLALQQFGIAGCVKDYQLWVISKRDNAPYPLIGHEYPYSVQMSHLREPLSQASSRDAVPPPDRQRALQPEQQLQADKQCQFILKPRRVTTAQQSAALEPHQKSFKRRRSLINWVFWRGSSPQLNDSSMFFSCPTSGCLFSQPLSSVCLDGALPKPVMDMLVFLYHEGPWTRGIFRRSAGARAVRELRDSLDSGVFELPLTRDHVFIIAGVFKDFLRNIPGSLLCSDLYEEWMDALEEEEEHQQTDNIQRLIARLPKENSLLLRYLVAVLHGIQGNAHDNQMTSFNLSVCIAPSMLWPPGPCSPEIEGEGAKKVCELVKFLIEHCQQILGQEVMLFGGPPQRLSSSDNMGTDMWCYPLTDSSYDSLENELDDYSSGGSPGLRPGRGRRRAKPLQGSLDSILTVSDCDHDTDPYTHCSQTSKSQDASSDNFQDILPLSGTHSYLQLPTSGRTRDKRLGPATVESCHSQGAPTLGTPSSLDHLSPDVRYRQRRRSEPAIVYTSGFQVCVSGNGLGLTGEDEDDVFKGPSCRHTHCSKGVCEPGSGLSRARKLLGLRASTSNLSSPPTSPLPTRSYLDALDSLHSLSSNQQTWQRSPEQLGLNWQPRAGICPAKTPPPSSSILLSPSCCRSSSSPSAPSTPVSAPATGPGPAQGACLKGSLPKEPLSWGTLRTSRGLHPNSWLKKARRLSLTQQDSMEREEERTGGGSIDKSLTTSKPGRGGKKGGKRIFPDLPKSKPSSRASKGRGGGGGGQEKGGKSVQDPPRTRPTSPPTHHRSMGSLLYPRSPCPQPSDTQLTAHQMKVVHHQDPPLTVHQAREIHDQEVTSHKGSEVANQEQANAGGDVSEPRRLPNAMFYGQQSGPTLSLFRRSTPEEQHQAWLSQRRASEPGPLQLGEALNQASTVHLSQLTVREHRLPSDPGLKVSEADPQSSGRSAEPRFCLSPCATKAVRDYFNSHRHSNPQSSQQVALALVEGHRQWVRRCSDPMAEPDFDQLLLAEESYV